MTSHSPLHVPGSEFQAPSTHALESGTFLEKLYIWMQILELYGLNVGWTLAFQHPRTKCNEGLGPWVNKTGHFRENCECMVMTLLCCQTRKKKQTPKSEEDGSFTQRCQKSVCQDLGASVCVRNSEDAKDSIVLTKLWTHHVTMIRPASCTVHPGTPA